ncbi:DUF6328 family protein [Cryptosporangium minutisporangium]|uniref:Uncharacterized protein n=1 Tax=Cryptosporangium minutisporangium TaxID=113569 RepID=A0ABP6TAH0_9ACTN
MARELTAASAVSGRSEPRDPRTRETPTQRWNRNYLEILHEVRAAQIGTQLLLVFLLTLAFTSRFADTTRFQRSVYVVSLVLVAGATCLLIAPAPFHRLVFRRRLEAQLVRASSKFALWGVTLLMLAFNGSLLLILDVVMGTTYALWITAGSLLWFLTWWYLAPGWARIGQRRRRKEATIAALEVASQKLRSDRLRDDQADGGDASRALGGSAPAGSHPALGTRPVAGADRGLPGPHPPQLRPGPTWPAPRLPMMPAPHPSLAGSDQLGYPGGQLPAVGYDRPSPQPGAATGPNSPYPPHDPSGAPGDPSWAPGRNGLDSTPRDPAGVFGRNGLDSTPRDPAGAFGRNGRNGPVPVAGPAPVSGPVGAIGDVRSGTGAPTGADGLTGSELPNGRYAAVDPLGPLALGAVGPVSGPGPLGGPVPLGDSSPFGGPGSYTTPFDGAAARGPRGRHHGISRTDLPTPYSTGDIPRFSTGDLPRFSTGEVPRLHADDGTPSGAVGDGMQSGQAGDGMQHGSAEHGVTQFGVALPLGPAPTGLPATGGEPAPTPAGAAGPASAGPALADPAPAGPPYPGGLVYPDGPIGPTDTGSLPVIPGGPSGSDAAAGPRGESASREGVIGRARVTPPSTFTPRHGYPTPEGT